MAVIRKAERAEIESLGAGAAAVSSSDAPREVAKPTGTGVLAGSDFTVMQSPKRQANILIYGMGGSAKTSFVTRYCPDPIALLAYDRRYEHAVAAATALGRHVYPCAIDFPAKKMDAKMTQAKAIEAMDKTVRNFEWACEQSLRGNIRTISIDTGTEYSGILKLSFDGVFHQTKEGAYGKDKDYVNRKWWDLFTMARDSKAHFVVTARAKEIWVKNPATGQQEATGRYTYRCPGVINDAVDWAGHIRLKEGLKGRLTKEFQLEITKAGANIAELCNVYTAKDWEPFGGPFTYASYMQFIETSELEDWT